MADDTFLSRVNDSVVLQLAARVLSIAVSLVGVPYVAWTVSSIYDHSARITVLEARGAANREDILDIKASVQGIQNLILARTENRYNVLDATRDFKVRDDRIDALERRIERLEQAILKPR